MKDFKQAAAVAKLYATESAVTATRIATQVFGGYGFMEEYPVARFYRDAKVLEIGEGTSEVQRMLIARGLGLPVEVTARRDRIPFRVLSDRSAALRPRSQPVPGGRWSGRPWWQPCSSTCSCTGQHGDHALLADPARLLWR